MPLTDAELDQLIEDLGLKRPRGGSARKPIAHGTFRGARQHRYRKEQLCQPCLDAETAYYRERRAGKPRNRKPQPKQYLTEEEWQARVAARRNGGESQ
ncbi:hypothetical protein [Streptomyces tendae]|uniref:hypothetical protein n=1 Tax=Streptomyces tendae TaxID=1932 RepID=UPI003EC10B9A